MPVANADDYASREIVTTRVFDAPRELVFRAWTQPDHVVKWWGPKGFTNTFQEFDFRPGGKWRLVMHGPNGTDYPGEFVFVEIADSERLVLDHVSQPHFRLTVLFEDIAGQTKITFRQLFESPDMLQRLKHIAVPGNEQNLDKLASELVAMGGGTHEMLMSRLVLAPRELVWKAWTDPVHVAKWWGPRGFSAPRCELDLRVGGKLHVDMQHPDGTVRPMIGQFLEIVPPERLVFTAMPLGPNGKPFFEATNAVDFRQEGPMTRINLRATVEKIHDPIALRFLSGRDQGWSESLYRLADTLDEMAGAVPGKSSPLTLNETKLRGG
jgi:uncharacterized protein YndB with AHSA1/START domain